jgi:hypothetical protein
MNPRQQRLWIRRQELLHQSSELRDRLQRHAEGLAPVLCGADRAWATGLWLRDHPLVPAAALLLLVWRRPRALWHWGRRGWSAWQLLRRVRAAWDARASAPAAQFLR